MAGGETTGTVMTTTTYYLLKNPSVHETLKKEIRTAYKNFSDIDYASATQLPYLMGVLKEVMRIFPVAAQGVPRESPGVMVERHYVPKGVS